jgi:hypothetical protein
MKTILDSEREIGKFDSQRLDWDAAALEMDHLHECDVVAHTRADLNHARGIMKIEQRCFMRANGQIVEQPWIAPTFEIESVDGDEIDALEMAQAYHERFCDHARQRLCDEALV